jgi:hypothetical protein
MADEKHEDKKPETAKPTEVIGKHITESTTAPTTAHPASVRPGAGPVHSIASSTTPAAAPPIASTPEPSVDTTAATAPTPGEHAACPDCGAKQNVSKKSWLTKLEEAFERRWTARGRWLGLHVS